jgi:hypothetical protein
MVSSVEIAFGGCLVGVVAFVLEASFPVLGGLVVALVVVAFVVVASIVTVGLLVVAFVLDCMVVFVETLAVLAMV